jgi:hypothetical protein
MSQKFLSLFLLFLLLLAACSSDNPLPTLAIENQPTLVFIFTDN